jgi:zinc protease
MGRLDDKRVGCRPVSLRRTSFRASAAVAVVALFATPARAQTTYAPVQERHLDNGMTVIVQEDHKVPLVSLTLRYDAGPEAPAGLEATAALTTVLMIRATKHTAPGDYTRLLARAGASGVSDRTTGDNAILEATVPSNRLALPLWLWSDQMGFFDATLDDAQLEAQRTKLREQRRASLEGSPMGRLDRFADEELYPQGHPYRSLSWLPQEVDHVDRAALTSFHDTWITPQHATLVLVGDVTPADAFALVEHYFAAMPHAADGKEGKGAAPALPAVTLPRERRVNVAANVPRAHVSIRWPTPRLFMVEDARLDVLARLLSGTRTAWLYWKLVDDAKIATGVTARERSGAFGSQFEIMIDGAKGKSPADLLAAFDAAMGELHSQNTDSRQLDGALYETLIDRQMLLERPTTRAGEYAKSSALVGVADNLGKDFERYDHITSSILHETLTKWLPSDRRVVLLVTPTPGAAAGGERAGGTP